MQKWQKHDLEQIKATLSIVRVAQDLGLEVQGRKMRCLHPQNHVHGDRTPSVTLSEERGYFKCWVCDAVKGDVFSLVQLARQCSFRDALEWLTAQYGLNANQQMPSNPTQGVGQTHVAGTLSATSSANPSATSSATQSPSAYPKTSSTKSVAPRPSTLDIPAVLLDFFRLLQEPSGAVERYLNRRKIFRKTIIKQKIRMIHNYQEVNEQMKTIRPVEEWVQAGLCNEKGNLRYYKHPLLFPYLAPNDFRPCYFQARAIEPDVTPKELSFRGTIPCPYNAPVLNKQPGIVYLCEGVIDALTMIDKGFTAVGIPGVKNFKKEWVPLFENKKVNIVFDNDEAGRSGAKQVYDWLQEAAIQVDILDVIPEGLDINSLLGGKAF